MNKTATILGLAVSLWAASAVAQPADLSAQIRNEGLGNSQAGAYVAELADGIGARLMGSPNMAKAYDWTEAKLKALGAVNVHREDIGEFGLSWRQDNAWLRMSAPDSMVLLAQAQPWSAPSKGTQEGEAVAVSLGAVADFDKYRGKLKGKIVLLGPLRAMQPVTTPLVRHWTDEELSSGQAAEVQRQYHLNIKTRWAARAKAAEFAAQRDAFLKGEGILGLILPSRDNDMGNGGTGNILVDVSGQGWTAATQVNFPVLIASYESFGRAWRLASAGKPVRMQFEVKATTLSEHEHGFNVVGEIPGTDPQLKSQVVMLGAHLDSWGSGTGAVDNGAGVAANLEVLRILKAVGAKPRRTIRVVLFCAEEEGLYGSTAYVNKHFGLSTAASAPRMGEVIAAADLKTLSGVRDPVGLLQPRPRLGPHPWRLRGQQSRDGQAVLGLDRAAEGPGRAGGLRPPLLSGRPGPVRTGQFAGRQLPAGPAGLRHPRPPLEPRHPGARRAGGPGPGGHGHGDLRDEHCRSRRTDAEAEGALKILPFGGGGAERRRGLPLRTSRCMFALTSGEAPSVSFADSSPRRGASF
jgi:carboxypeptidase Q